MTEEEHERLCQVGDEFWDEFSTLCNRYIDVAPHHLRDVYVMYLGDKTSIYGALHELQRKYRALTGKELAIPPAAASPRERRARDTARASPR